MTVHRANGTPTAAGSTLTHRVRRAVLAVLAVAVIVPPALALDASVASAAPTFTVNTTVDAPDALVNGTCATAAGQCTLRAAVAEANGTTGAQIVVPAGTYTLNSTSGTDTGDLDLKKPVTITGTGSQPGSAATTINGNAKDRVFEVLATGVVLDGLVITNGNAGTGLGGGIFVNSGQAVTVRNSTISANKAAYGGGIKTYGTVTVDRSTLSNNTATTRGGAIYVAGGTLTVTNSTLDSNTSAGGGAIGSTGTVQLKASTVTNNSAGTSKGGGISRESGSFTITSSILAGNTAGTGPNCSGSPALAGTNVIQSTTGCTSSGTAAIVADPKLGSLTDNGGATLTRLPGSGSPAIDAYPAPCATTTDQRNVSRTPPPGGNCDVGAVESAPLTVSVALSASAPPRTPACDPGVVCIGAGASQVATAKIPTKALVASSNPADSANPTYLRRTYLRRTYLRRTYLRRTDLLASPVSDLTLNDLYLRRTYLRRTGGSPTPAEQVLLSDIPLYLPDGRTWQDLLAGTAFQGVPLQNITLAQVLDLPQVGALTIGQADITTTALKDLSGVALALAPLSLDKIPLGDSGTALSGWCDFLANQVPGGCGGLGIDPANPATASDVGLVTLQLAGMNIEDLGLESIYLRRTDLSSTYLRRTYLRRTDLSASAIGSVYLRRTGPVDAVVDCTKVACDGSVSLAQAQSAGAIKDTATVGDLLDYLAAQPEYQNLSLLDLMLVMTQAFFPGDGQAFEQIDLAATPLQNAADPAEPPVTYSAAVTVGGGVAANTKVALTLPNGFEPVAGSATFDGATIPDGTRSGQVLTFNRSSVAVGPHTLTVAARAGLELGQADASVKVDATAGSQQQSATSSTSVQVVESFEKHDTPDDTRTLGTGSINIAHLNSSYDTDLYSFYVSPTDAASGITEHLDLSNLAHDYDLVLYGPKVSPLRGTPKSRLQPVDDTGVGYDTSTAQLAPDVQRDVALTPPPDCGVPGTPQTCEPYAVSAQRGTKDELIETGTLVPGTYWVEVRGYNGAFGPEPFVLRRVEDRGTPLGVCAVRPASPASSGPTVTYPTGVTAATSRGHFVVADGRFLQQYGAAAQPMLDQVAAVAALTGNDVVHVDADPAVKAAYDTWDANPCSVEASNGVVRAIGKVLDTLDAAGPGASSVTLIGNHDMVPQALVPDGTAIGNENTYSPGVQKGQDTSVSAALKAGYLFTDNPYGTSAGYSVNTAELYVPEKAVGRLVETPQDITAALQRFQDAGGVLDPATTTSAFVSGYDFVADGAAQTADQLAAQGATVNRLINETWTKADLKAGLITGNPDIASLSGHFDHNRALPALGNSTGDESDTFKTSDVAGAGNLAKALVFSIGCHSGLSVPDIELALTDPTDWAQTFSAEGATYLGNTGYGYGDSDLVAFSERLQVLFAQQLRTGAPTGAALMAAKQAYFSDLAAVTPYDIKVLSEFTLYGLPMWKVGGTFPTTPTSVPPVVGAAPAAPDVVAQPPVSLSIGNAGDPKGDGVLTPNTTDGGTYYDVNGRTLAVQYRPAEPFVDKDVTRAGRLAHGVVITDAASVDQNGFTPHYVKPILDQAANEKLADPVGDAVFPATLARVTNPVGADGTRTSSVVLAAGQFRRNGGTAGTGTQRLFTRIDTQVTYADAAETDFEAPTILRSEANVVDSTVGFAVRTSTDTQRVYILYKVADGSGEWSGLDLVRTGTDATDGSAIWTGGAVLPAAGLKIEFLGQAVDSVGNVAYTDNKTSNFLAAPTENCTLGSTIAPAAALTPSGWYVAPDGVTVTFAQPGLQVSLDGGPFAPVPAGGLLVTGEGVHQVKANSTNASCSLVVPIDTRGPVTATALDAPPNAGGWNSGPVTVKVSASDPGGSGVKQLTYSVNGGAPVVVDGSSADVTVSAKGDTVITYSSVDAAGNPGPSGTSTVKIDGIAPTVTSVVLPPDVNGWIRGPASVAVSATDGETGIKEIRTTVGAAAPVVTPGASATVPVTAEGVTTVGYTAVDLAGNEASGTATVRIDTAGPSIAITSPPASITGATGVTAGYTCADPTSGVASCQGVLTGPGVNTPIANGAALPALAAGSYTLTVTAVDVAGNTSTATRPFTVGYGVCLKYDPATRVPLLATIVLKFQLCDSAGNNLSSPSLAVAATKVDGTIQPAKNIWGLFNLGYGFYYDSSSKSYIYALPTPGIGAGNHNLGFSVNGSTSPTYVLPFALKK